MPKISIIHPSRMRIKLATECYHEWMSKASDKSNIEYILSCDTDDPELTDYAIFARENHIKLIFAGNKNVVQAMNSGIRLVTGDVIVGVSDDFSCPHDWDLFILENIDPSKEEALVVDDGLQPVGNDILTLPILTRKLVDKLGFIYYPEYTGIYADDDLAQLCKVMGCLKTNYTKVWQHRHWANQQKPRDETNNRHDNPDGWALGRKIFAERKAINFGI